MDWLILLIAGFFEASFAACLGKAHKSEGHIYWFWMSGFIICLLISMYLLYLASQKIPIGTAYAVWTGIGAIGTVIVGIIFFQEPAHFWRLFFLSTLIISIVGLKVLS